MPLMLTPEVGVPVTPQEYIPDLIFGVDAAVSTTALLAGYGADLIGTASDDEQAAEILLQYAQDPIKAQRALTKQTPASVLQIQRLMKEFADPVVEEALKIRHYVVNRLLLESDNVDSRIRIRALEMLGRISEVGLFDNHSEVTVTHQTTDDLRDKLRQKLAKLISPELYRDDNQPETIDITPEQVQ